MVAALRAAGCSVAVTSSLGRGFPDLVVASPRGRTVLLEVKDGDKPPSRQRLTDDEAQFHAAWKGEVFVVNSPQQAVDVVLRCAPCPTQS